MELVFCHLRPAFQPLRRSAVFLFLHLAHRCGSNELQPPLDLKAAFVHRDVRGSLLKKKQNVPVVCPDISDRQQEEVIYEFYEVPMEAPMLE